MSRMTRFEHRTASLATAALAGALVACSDPERDDVRSTAREDAAAPSGHDAAVPEGLQRWVGGAEGTDIRLGVVVDQGTRARFFFCGGPDTLQTASRWIIVSVREDGEFEYQSDGWRITGDVGRDALTGTLERGREVHEFAAAPVSDGTLAGLYEGVSECGRVGLIVTHANASDEPSAQGACLGAGDPQQVNPILPIALEDGSIRVRIGDTEARVREAAPIPR